MESLSSLTLSPIHSKKQGFLFGIYYATPKDLSNQQNLVLFYKQHLYSLFLLLFYHGAKNHKDLTIGFIDKAVDKLLVGSNEPKPDFTVFFESAAANSSNREHERDKLAFNEDERSRQRYYVLCLQYTKFQLRTAVRYQHKFHNQTQRRRIRKAFELMFSEFYPTLTRYEMSVLDFASMAARFLEMRISITQALSFQTISFVSQQYSDRTTQLSVFIEIELQKSIYRYVQQVNRHELESRINSSCNIIKNPVLLQSRQPMQKTRQSRSSAKGNRNSSMANSKEDSEEDSDQIEDSQVAVRKQLVSFNDEDIEESLVAKNIDFSKGSAKNSKQSDFGNSIIANRAQRSQKHNDSVSPEFKKQQQLQDQIKTDGPFRKVQSESESQGERRNKGRSKVNAKQKSKNITSSGTYWGKSLQTDIRPNNFQSDYLGKDRDKKHQKRSLARKPSSGSCSSEVQRFDWQQECEVDEILGEQEPGIRSKDQKSGNNKIGKIRRPQSLVAEGGQEQADTASMLTSLHNLRRLKYEEEEVMTFQERRRLMEVERDAEKKLCLDFLKSGFDRIEKKSKDRSFFYNSIIKIMQEVSHLAALKLKEKSEADSFSHRQQNQDVDKISKDWESYNNFVTMISGLIQGHYQEQTKRGEEQVKNSFKYQGKSLSQAEQETETSSIKKRLVNNEEQIYQNKQTIEKQINKQLEIVKQYMIRQARYIEPQYIKAPININRCFKNCNENRTQFSYLTSNSDLPLYSIKKSTVIDSIVKSKKKGTNYNQLMSNSYGMRHKRWGYQQYQNRIHVSCLLQKYLRPEKQKRPKY